MVERETVESPPLAPGGVTALRAHRDPAGNWWLTLSVDAAFRLPDGRELRFTRAVRIRGVQRGRKPNPPGWKPGRKRSPKA